MYNVYKNGVKVGTTNDKQYLFTDLTPGTSYKLGVSRVDGDRESEIVTVSAMTEDLPIEPPFDLIINDVGDKYIEVAWDCDAPLGTARFNIYLDGVIKESGFIGRNYVMKNLEPSTEYTISVTAIRDNEETVESNVTATTHAPIGDDEPIIPSINELHNLTHPIGDFDAMGDWVLSGSEDITADISDEWSTHGNSSLKLTIGSINNWSTAIGNCDITQDLTKGKYLAVVDYKKPQGENMSEEEVIKSHHATLSIGDKLVQNGFGTGGILYAVYEVKEASKGVWLSVGAVNHKFKEASDFYFDALRVYKITDELYSYIKGGKMHDDRIEEVFPYVDNTVATLSADVSDYHTGGGYYDLPNGERVRGKDNAVEVLERLLDE